MKLNFTLITLLLCLNVTAQQFEWIVNNDVINSLNPSTPKYNVADDHNHSVIATGLVSDPLYYGIDVYGRYSFSKYDSLGNLTWTKLLGDSIEISFVDCDLSGNVIIGGSFMGSILDSGTVLLSNTGSGFNVDHFIMKFSSAGILQYVHNLSSAFPLFELRALKVSGNGELWFSIDDFGSSTLIHTDTLFSIIDSITFNGVRMISSIDTDPGGNIYTCGALGSGLIQVGGLSMVVSDAYNFFICKLNASLAAEWLHTAHDETFHTPFLKYDNNAVYMTSDMIDSLSWGNVSFTTPPFTFDFFLIKFDLSGNAVWGKQVPSGAVLGRMQIASAKPLTITSAGNILLFGVMSGTINWGNGVTATTAAGTDMLHIVNFDANGVAQWQKTFGSANGGNYPWSIDGAGNHIYTAQLLTLNGAFDTIASGASTTQDFVVASLNVNSPVGIIENSAEEFIYPNPATEFVNLPFVKIQEQISIYDCSMRIIRSEIISDKKLNVSDLSEGIYILKTKEHTFRLSVVSKN